jgi:hypothetical protein
MSTRDVSWREPRHCIEEHLEHHMWNITEGPAKNTDYAKAITRLARRWPTLEIVPDVNFEWKKRLREWCVLDLIRAMGENEREMGGEPVINILSFMPEDHEVEYVPDLEHEGDVLKWAPMCNTWYCSASGECWG